MRRRALPLLIGGNYAPPGAYNFKASNTSRLRRALASGGVIMFGPGDSKFSGYGAAPVTQPMVAAEPNCLGNLVAGRLRARGINADRTTRWADSNDPGAGAGAMPYDERISFGSSAWGPSTATAGGSSFVNTTDTARMSILQDHDTDTAVCWAQRNTGLATYKCEVGGVQIGSNVDLAVSPNAVVSNMFQTTKGSNRWDFSRVSGGGFRIIGFEAYDSTLPNLVRVWVMSAGGSTTATWVDVANATRAGSVLQTIASQIDCAIIALTRNDCDTSVAHATVQANLLTIAGYFTAAGCDVIFVIPTGQLTSVTPDATQLLYDNDITTVARALDKPWVSHRYWFGGTYAVRADLSYDSTHENADGYAFEADHWDQVFQYVQTRLH